MASQRKALEFHTKAASPSLLLALSANPKSGAKCLGANYKSGKRFRKVTKTVLAFEEELLCSATHFLNAILGILPYPPRDWAQGTITPICRGHRETQLVAPRPLGESAEKPSSEN